MSKNAQINDEGKISEDSDYSGDENEIVAKQPRVDSREKDPKSGSVEARDNTN